MVAFEAKERSLQGRSAGGFCVWKGYRNSWNFGNPMMSQNSKMEIHPFWRVIRFLLAFLSFWFSRVALGCPKNCKRVGDFFFWGKATKDGFPTPKKSHGSVNHCDSFKTSNFVPYCCQIQAFAAVYAWGAGPASIIGILT